MCFTTVESRDLCDFKNQLQFQILHRAVFPLWPESIKRMYKLLRKTWNCISRSICIFQKEFFSEVYLYKSNRNKFKFSEFTEIIFTYTSDLENWLKATFHSLSSSTLWRQCWKHLYFNCFFFFYWSKTYLAVETKSLSSPPCSSNCSRVLASPVDWRPMTTHWKITSEISTFLTWY